MPTASVSVTISENNLEAWARYMEKAVPDIRARVATGGPSGTCTFEDDAWDNPVSSDFEAPGVPFLGTHGGGDGFLPGKMAGDGVFAMDFPTDESGAFVLRAGADGEAYVSDRQRLSDMLRLIARVTRFIDDPDEAEHLDPSFAYREGWYRLKDGEIKAVTPAEKGDPPPVFRDDARAVAHVSALARAGSAYHSQALRMHLLVV